MHQVGFIYKR